MSERPIELDADAIRAYLARHGTGVLSLADSDEPYSTPVSYGFDPDARTFYFRLGFGDGGEKRRFLDQSVRARFVVYGETDDGWYSVIAKGVLERVEASDVTHEVARNLRRADLPLLDIWPVPVDEIEFEVYRLDVEELTGRRSVGDEP